MALLAATLGVDGSTLRAEVRATAEVEDVAEYSLIVQTYDGPMRRGARPVGSVHRVVTGAELRAGVHVSLVELRESPQARPPSEAVVVAWVERGRAKLDDDARTARPQPGSLFGRTRRAVDEDSVAIALTRRRLA